MDISDKEWAREVALPKRTAERIKFAVQFWDETERLTKQAEQINQAMVVPAISELRYAGRKLIDYLQALDANDPEERQREHIEDFTQCCIRARHDAIDAAVSYFIQYFEALENRINPDIIEAKEPTYPKIKKSLFEAAAMIVASRKDRRERNKIYGLILENNDFSLGEIVDFVRTLEEKRSELFKIQKKRDARHEVGVWALFIAISVSALVLIFSLVS